ncbi:MAG: nitrous oxide-stimulated promoter family protein [candidate division KSB1 bacterium]|nr:nitrous oxide-stimulated promoter family protein [candidate division KSB1 bacterium]
MKKSRRRLRREKRTVLAMISIYCRAHHGGKSLCDDCRELADYTERRIDACPYRSDKPTCVNCPTHCYKPAMRERIRAVMRYAGPRMLFRHPWLTLLHMLDRRKSPRF